MQRSQRIRVPAAGGQSRPTAFVAVEDILWAGDLGDGCVDWTVAGDVGAVGAVQTVVPVEVGFIVVAGKAAAGAGALGEGSMEQGEEE